MKRQAQPTPTNAVEPSSPGKLQQETDGTLMQWYQQGELAAFDEIYRRHSPKVYGYLRGRTSSRQQSDDLLQSCFLKLHQSRHQYDPSKEFLPWFWSILRSVLADSLRSDLRNPAKANASEDHSRSQWESIADPVEAHSKQSIVFQSEALSGEFLNELSPSQRKLIELRAERELSFEEIGQELSIPPATARQRFSRLVRKIRDRLGNSMQGGHHE